MRYSRPAGTPSIRDTTPSRHRTSIATVPPGAANEAGVSIVTGDTKVVDAGHGDGVFEKLRGQFAIALWDERRQHLLLARDRFGSDAIIAGEHDDPRNASRVQVFHDLARLDAHRVRDGDEPAHVAVISHSDHGFSIGLQRIGFGRNLQRALTALKDRFA